GPVHGHARIHGPRAVARPGGSRQRSVQPRLPALRVADGREAVRRLERLALHVAAYPGGATFAAEVRARAAARPGDGDAEVPGEGERSKIRGLPGTGRRPAALAGRRAGAGAARGDVGEAGALGAAQAGGGGPGDGRDGGDSAAGSRGRGDVVLV